MEAWRPLCWLIPKVAAWRLLRWRQSCVDGAELRRDGHDRSDSLSDSPAALSGGAVDRSLDAAAVRPTVNTPAADRSVKKLSVLLPADLHRRARRHALLHDKTLTTLIIELLNQALEESAPEQAPG
jgi:hypothetical protein